MRDGLDKLIKEAYLKKASEIEVDTDVALARLYERLEKEQQSILGVPSEDKKENVSTFIKDKRTFTKFLIACSLVLAFISGSLFTEKATAINHYISKVFGETELSRHIKINVDAPINNLGTDGIEEFKTPEEAKPHIKIPIRIPNYIPKDFTLDKITLRKVGAIERVSIMYQGNDGSFRITELVTSGGSSAFINADKENSKLETYVANGIEYTIIIFDNGNISCKYADQNLIVQLESIGLSLDEFRKTLISINTGANN